MGNLRISPTVARMKAYPVNMTVRVRCLALFKLCNCWKLESSSRRSLLLGLGGPAPGQAPQEQHDEWLVARRYLPALAIDLGDQNSMEASMILPAGAA